MPTGTFVYTGAGKKLNDGETDPCLINKTCRRLACDIQWCRELYLGADVHRQHTDVHVAHTEHTWRHRAMAPTRLLAHKRSPLHSTLPLSHAVLAAHHHHPFHTWPRTPRAHTLAVVRTLVSHHSPFPFPVSKRNYQVHKCQDFIDKWENCCNNAKKEAAVCAAQGKPYTWTKG